jgi:methionyl-tRNA synthetase
MLSDQSGKFYITTPIYYVNAEPHIGHAYTTIAADAVARFHRSLGANVFLLTGTDEHGQKNLEAARKAGISPQEHVDRISAQFRGLFEQMHCQFDRFIRTSDEDHVAAVQHVFDALRSTGDIYKGEYEGWYCVPCETFFLERDLENGNCPDCKRPVAKTTTDAYFFRTSHYAEAILKLLEDRPDFIQPESRRNEVAAFVEQGLQDACISRKASEWDIPVPGDPDQTVYVWFDALINYLTAAGFRADEARMQQWWPPDIQLVGKEILVRFHGTIWPAMLMALGLPLPGAIFTHGYLLSPDRDRGEEAFARKIAKRHGDLVNPYEVAKQVADVSGCKTDIAVDAVRYFLLREITFGLDGVFKVESVMQRFNDDLANDLGNLLNRTLPLVERFADGKVPEAGPAAGGLAEEIEKTTQQVETGMAALDFGSVLGGVWQLLAAANRFVDERAPWDLHKAGKSVELDATLYDMLDCLRVTAVMVFPFMPAVAEEIWAQLGLTDSVEGAGWGQCAAGRLPSGGTIARGKPIFPRIDMRRAKVRLEGPESEQAPAEAAGGEAPTISIEEFARLDLRVGRIESARKVPGKDRLLELEVDLGGETRTVAAGMAEEFSPDSLIGKHVVLVANLKPAKIGGVRSHGMILAAGDEKPLALVTLDRECPLGTKVR